jgi:signal transduction histidine kinase
MPRCASALDPFFTTKPLGKGTGLGLSMTFGYVRQSSGYLKIESQPGEGTTIMILMPRTEEIT